MSIMVSVVFSTSCRSENAKGRQKYGINLTHFSWGVITKTRQTHHLFCVRPVVPPGQNAKTRQIEDKNTIPTMCRVFAIKLQFLRGRKVENTTKSPVVFVINTPF